MKILVVGQGGREHAILRALQNSPQKPELFASPGNDGMTEAQVLGSLSNTEIVEACRQQKIDLIIIGPEEPLVNGLGDELRNAGFLVFGPSQKAAQLEASKNLAKEFLAKHKIPAAHSVKVSNLKETLDQARAFQPPYVLKYDGLAAGKGVFICAHLLELEQAAKKIFTEKIFSGSIAPTAILEEHLQGWELSALVLTNGINYKLLPIAQDHKRLSDGDSGPNTGGMGTIAPLNLPESLLTELHEKIITPSINGLHQESWLYRGVLFIGVMVTKSGPRVLEYNVRFGDPETQVILPLLDSDAVDFFLKIAQGEIPLLSWKKAYAACVVLAAQGYPDFPIKGKEFSFEAQQKTFHQYVLVAGAKREHDNIWKTQGGRVLNSIGIGTALKDASDLAYQQISPDWRNTFLFRTDIGKNLK